MAGGEILGNTDCHWVVYQNGGKNIIRFLE